MATISNKIKQLINQRKEADYFDFKKQWYAKNFDLIHDILCMANSLSSEDERYIIIGVDDRDFSLHSVDEGQKRFKSHLLTDMLEKIYCNTMPSVRVERIRILKNTLDVIIIEKTNFRPYFLLANYEDNGKPEEPPNSSSQSKKRILRAGVIYTRVGDKNTPYVGTAEASTIEKLWKIRFGLYKLPIERAKEYLNQSQKWRAIDMDDAVIKGDIYYYEDFPEFTVALEPTDREYVESSIISCFFNTNPGEKINCYLKYHQTILAKEPFITVDGGRYLVALPELNYLEDEKRVTHYYEKNSMRYLLSVFIDQQKDTESHGLKWFIKMTKTKII